MLKLTYKKLLTFLTLTGCLVWLAVWQFPDQKLKVIFCDVGQGDATLIVQGFNQILIDGGPNDKVLTCLKNNMPFWDKKIEIAALTHPESDHMTGLISVFDKYEVEYFLSGPEGNKSAGYQALLKKFQLSNSKSQTNPNDQNSKSKIIIINPYSGDKIKLGSITLNTIWPSREFVAENIDTTVIPTERAEGERVEESLDGVYPAFGGTRDDNNHAVLGAKTTHSKLNDFSLVFLLTYDTSVETRHAASLQIKNNNKFTDDNNVETGHAPSLQKITKILLMGDADRAVQNKITADGKQLTALNGIDILKFPHHGSKTGMTESFLEQINPKEAVISVGKNSYGHPTSEALEMLKLFNVLIRRTDLEGEIKYEF